VTDHLPAEPATPAELARNRTPTPTPKGERTRALILETAMRLFQERGYDKTTMRAIATEAGASVGQAYYHFASKEYRRNHGGDRVISLTGSLGERG
jgi:AcrR family transcriptional regulator